MIQIFLFLTFCIFSLHSEIIHVTTLDEFSQECQTLDSDCLVLFDVDGTLIIPKDKILKPQAEQHLHDIVSKAWKYKHSDSEARHDKCKLYSTVMKTMKFDLVDQEFPKLIEELQKKNVKTLGLTAMGTGPYCLLESREEWRFEQLKDFGIEFRPSFPSLPKFYFLEFSSENGYPGYYKGIIFSSDIPKGIILATFLENMKWKPKKIIFIDDILSFVTSVDQEVAKLQIPFKGFHYRNAYQEPSEIDEEIVLFQIDYLLHESKWLSDSEAEILVQKKGHAKKQKKVQSTRIYFKRYPLIDRE